MIIGFFKRKSVENRAKMLENRSETQQETLNASLVALFGGTDMMVTRSEALQVPTVAACINKISETVARLPVKLHKNSSGEVEEIKNDCRTRILNGETGDTLNTVDFWKSMIADYYVGCGGWAYINKKSLDVKSLHYIENGKISIMKNTDPIFKSFDVLVDGKRIHDFHFLKILRRTIDGCTNIPLQEENGKIISAAYNALKLEIANASSGGCKGGFLKSKSRLTQDTIDRIKSGYEDLYGNASSKKVIVLNEGIDFQQISATAVEMQMNENKNANSVEICKIFGFPHTVIDGGATDDDNKKFIDSVVALLNQIETSLDRDLLLEVEKDEGYYFAFDTKEITRGSVKDRYEAYQIALKNRFLTIDEVRTEEDAKPLGFNFVPLGLGDVLLDVESMQVFTPNTGQMADLNTMTAKGGEKKE